MVGWKKTIAIIALLMMSLMAFAVPAQAQFEGSTGQFGGQFPGMGGNPFQGMGGDPFSSMGGNPFQGMGGDPFSSMGGDPFSGMMGSPFSGMMGMQSPQREWSVRVWPTVTQGSGIDLMASLERIPELSLCTAALKASGYGDKLRGQGKYVVFAPSDRAIQRDLSVKDVDALISNSNLVRGIVENCVVEKPIEPAAEGKKPAIIALNGREIVMQRGKSGTTANGADVLRIFNAGNGVLIVTDGAVGT
jgi:hypothetical protein